MNKVILMGRLTRDPEVRYSQGGENPLAIARFTLAVDRRFKRDGEATADFINCVAFGRQAEHAERFYRQGLKVVITGRIQTGSYTNKDGVKVYTTDIVVEEQEFAESKAVSDANAGGYRSAPTPAPAPAPVSDAGDGFMNIPDGIDEELPFS
ncbi:MAG: single-stranded DNA-binding protein [Dorea sp.]|jgi:single-strand DNA-binding protein|uniref:single-stranded DNA-binding protein n=1 Tax=Sporofaciens sp. JLR.KK001 TaxID=3112621 RepID=UPI0021726424|nr:single-stranded DNA-binding protein [Dorea sp.]